MNSFFRELRRRKVYGMALSYAVVAWLVVQISATDMPSYHAPEWILAILSRPSRVASCVWVSGSEAPGA